MNNGSLEGGTPLQISTIAEPGFISITSCRGRTQPRPVHHQVTGHLAFQPVREMILSDAGVTRADIYTAGGEVLMGTMRWEKESASGWRRKSLIRAPA